MGSQKKASRRRRRNEGTQAYHEMLPILQRWFPLAFPPDDAKVRPLDGSRVTKQLRDEFDWPRDFAAGVLRRWQWRRAYARAVLAHSERIDLYGNPAANVGDRGRAMAGMWLEKTRLTRRCRKLKCRMKKAKKAAKNVRGQKQRIAVTLARREALFETVAGMLFQHGPTHVQHLSAGSLGHGQHADCDRLRGDVAGGSQAE